MSRGNTGGACCSVEAPVVAQGAFHGFTVASLMQLIERDGLNCAVQVGGEGLQRGVMLFQGGEPFDAACGSLLGDQAVLAMVGWGSVNIVFRDIAKPLPAKTVSGSSMELIMEGLRLMDERLAEEDLEPVRSTENGEQQSVSKKGENKMAGLKQMMKDIADEMDGVIAVGIVGMDGITVAVHNPTGADMDVVSAKFAMVMKLVERSVEDMDNLGNFEENLVQTANAWILTRFLDKQYYLACIVSREGTLGNVRLVAKKYLEQVQRAL